MTTRDQQGSSVNDVVLRWALQYRELGWAVFPLGYKSKVPLKNSHGFKDATKDADRIEEMFGSAKEPLNISIATGDISGLLVLDIDPRHGGDKSLGKLEEKYGPLPKTCCVETGGGGMHYYFPLPPDTTVKSSAGIVAEGIDVRATKGHVVAPPSIHPSGNPYKWCNRDITTIPDINLPDIPAWLLERISTKSTTLMIGDQVDTGQIIRKGTRDETLFHVHAKFLVLQGHHGKSLFRALYKINQEQCHPPLSKKQVEKIAAQAEKYFQRPGNSLTEVDIATFAYNVLKRQIRYCHDNKSFYIWDGHHWERDRSDKIFELVTGVFTMLKSKNNVNDVNDRHKKNVAIIKKTGTHRFMKIVVDLLTKIFPDIKVPITAFDQEKNFLCVANGDLNLRTGELSSHDPKRMFSKITSVGYYPRSKCPKFMKFLSQIFMGNQELIVFFQTALGYSLTGHTGDRCVFVLYGFGANGKSTLLATIRKIFAPYAEQINTESLMQKRYGNADNDMARLVGVRIAIASEGEEHQRWAAARIKQISGGDIPITAKELYKDVFTYVPQFKVWFDTNNLPKTNADDIALWDRMKIIKFNARFTGESQRPREELDEELISESEGILAFAVEGAKMYFEQKGLKTPEIVLAEVRQYRDDVDIVKDFIEECCVKESNSSVKASVLHERFCEWCKKSSIHPFSKSKFGRSLKSKGYKSHKSGFIVYEGIRLLPSGSPSEGGEGGF